MKKIINVFLTGVLILIISACGSEKTNGKIKIGISKIVAHPALDAVEQGIQDELAAQGIDAEFDLQNANGDVNTAASIASKFKTEKVDISIGIATPTAQALANAIKDKPVIYAAVTDPVSAGLVDSYEKGGKNVTGVSDMTPVKEQLIFLSRIKKISKLGHIYSSHEDNAVALAKIVKTSCDELGIELVESTISNSSEVKQAAQSIAGRVDAFYVSTDNTVVSALSSLVDVGNKNGIPVMSADPSSAEKIGVLAAWGFDYYKMGRATGRLVADIINGKKCQDIPTLFMTDPKDIDLLINKDAAKKLNLSFPADVVENAAKIFENGKLIKK